MMKPTINNQLNHEIASLNQKAEGSQLTWQILDSRILDFRLRHYQLRLIGLSQLLVETAHF